MSEERTVLPVSEKQEHRKRYNLRLQYIAEFNKWLDREPPICRYHKWRKWKSERPVWRYIEFGVPIVQRGAGGADDDQT